MKWTPQDIAELKHLWARGLTGAEIGFELHRSRNSVLGCVHRLGLPMRGMPEQLMTRKKKKHSRRPLPPDPNGDGVSLSEVTGCRYMTGKNLYCNAVIYDGSWCKFHARICFQGDQRALKVRLADSNKPHEWVDSIIGGGNGA